MRTILLLTFLFSPFLVISQIKIVKDNISCKYGIKHIDGEWLHRAEYDLIEKITNGHFRALKNNNWGILNHKGAFITEMIYDRISYENHHFMVMEKGTTGVLDSFGKPVIKTGEYKYIKHLLNDFYIATIKGKKEWYLLKNNVRMHSRPCKQIYPISAQGPTYIYSKEHSFLRRKARIITLEGDTVVIYKNGKIVAYNQHFILSNKNSTTIYDALLNPLKKLPFSKINVSDIPNGNQLENVIFRFYSGKKMGLANMNGKILVPAVYDLIQKNAGGGIKYAYQLVNNGNIGFIDNSYKISVPCQHHYHYSLPNQYHILLKKNGYFAFFDHQAKQVTPFKYKLLSNFLSFHFYDAKNIYHYKTYAISDTIPQLTSLIDTAEFVIKLGGYHVYHHENRYYTLEKNSNNWILPDNNQVTFKDSLFQLYSEWGTITYDLNGNTKYPKKAKQFPIKVIPLDDHKFISRKDGYYGITEGDSTWILNPENFAIVRNEVLFKNLVWVKKSWENKSRFQNAYAGGWQLYNLNGTPYSDVIFDIPISISNNILPVYVNNRCGIYDFDKKEFIREPIYDQVNDLFGSTAHWLLFDKDGGFYLLKEDGSFQSEIKWQHVVKINLSASALDFPNKNIIRGNFFNILLNEKDTLVISDQGDTTSNSALVKSLLYKGNYFNYENNETRISNTNFIHFRNKDTAFRVMNEFMDYLIKTDKYDFKYKPYKTQVHSDLMVHTGHESKSLSFTFPFGYEINDWVTGHFHHLDENYISLRNYKIIQWDYNPSRPTYINLYRSYGYLFEFSLKDLFRKEVNLEDAMIILLTEAIHLRDDLQLDCHKPQTIFDRTGESFGFDQNGIKMYIQDERSAYQEILIPWQKLKKYAPEKGIVADFLSKEIK